MRADEALKRLGGVATTEALLRHTSKSRIRVALKRRRIVRDGRGRYSLPGVDEAYRSANRLGGVLSEDSAAQAHGWKLKHVPVSPCVTVRRKRNLKPHQRRGVRVRYVDLDPDDVNGLVTRPVATVIGCAARMPFDEALAIADSALREGAVTKEELIRAAEAQPARYRARCLRVAEAADGRADNPFESVLRAIALQVVGLTVEPQQWVGATGRADLVDKRLRLVVEADSFAFHGRRWMLKRDCERYNAFVLDGWLVIRFAYEHVMSEPHYVAQVLRAATELLGGPSGQALDAPGRAAAA
jgi:very-short-patch-repair endonuclease